MTSTDTTTASGTPASTARVRGTRSQDVALVLAALGLVPGGTHLLEYLPRTDYPPELYATVTASLYQLFGPVGAVVQVSAIVTCALATVLLRGTPARSRMLVATLALVTSLVLWAVLVAPVNAAWAEVFATAPALVPETYARLGPRWEAGHATAALAWLTGYVALVLASRRTGGTR